MRNLLCVMALALSFCAGPLHAGSLILTYEGVLTTGSVDPFGNDIDGLNFVVNAVFDPTPIDTDIGYGQYLVTHLSATVGTETFVELDPGYFSVEIVDPIGFGDPDDPWYLVGLTGDYYFAPIFVTATPVISGDSASPTVFSEYLFFSFGSELEILTSEGWLFLVYDDSSEVFASISAVPEPSTAILALMGGLGCSLAARRKKQSSAV